MAAIRVRAVRGRFTGQTAVLNNETIRTTVTEQPGVTTIELEHLTQDDFWMEIDVEVIGNDKGAIVVVP
jgi:hypothetical protein